MVSHRTAIIIPARYASSRFPGKALVPILGKPMIEHVYARSASVPGIDTILVILVATDDERIRAAVESFGEKPA
jgi:CMP-2-keto-3-deoxyoctulosonic acid synthetase